MTVVLNSHNPIQCTPIQRESDELLRQNTTND